MLKMLRIAFLVLCSTQSFAEQCQRFEFAEIKQMRTSELTNTFCDYRLTINLNSIKQKGALNIQMLAIKHGNRRDEVEQKNAYDKLGEENVACTNEANRIAKAAEKKISWNKLDEKCPLNK